MKTMTCEQLGGPCDQAHVGEDANVVIKAQDAHLKEAVAAGDTAHEPALKEMQAGGSTRSPGWAGTARPSVTLLPSRRTERPQPPGPAWPPHQDA